MVFDWKLHSFANRVLNIYDRMIKPRSHLKYANLRCHSGPRHTFSNRSSTLFPAGKTLSLTRLFPNHGLFTTLSSPVYTKTSYKKPPNTQPQNGETTGVYTWTSAPALQPSPSTSNTHPEIITPRTPHLAPIPQRITHQPRPKVPRQIQRIPRLEPETRSQPKNQKEQHQREQLPGPKVRIVLQREDHEHEQRAGDEFGEKHARARQEGLGVRAEDAGGGGLGGGHGAHAVAFAIVDGGDVVGVDDAGGAEAAEELGEEEDGEASPGEASEEAVAEGDGGVEVAGRLMSIQR